MALYIKRPCDTICGTDPCGCPFDVYAEANQDIYWDVTGFFVADQEVEIYLAASECLKFGGGVGGTFSQVLLYADGVLLYDSGCVTGFVTSVIVPMGTTEIRTVNVYNCDNECESGWSGDPTAFFYCVSF